MIEEARKGVLEWQRKHQNNGQRLRLDKDTEEKAER